MNSAAPAGSQWFESSRSSGSRECGETAHLIEGFVGVRDSTNPTRPTSVFAPGAWDAFRAGAKSSGIDRD